MSKKLVAYFSASGVTAKAAGKLAKAADADLLRSNRYSHIQEQIWTG